MLASLPLPVSKPMSQRPDARRARRNKGASSRLREQRRARSLIRAGEKAGWDVRYHPGGDEAPLVMVYVYDTFFGWLAAGGVPASQFRSLAEQLPPPRTGEIVQAIASGLGALNTEREFEGLAPIELALMGACAYAGRTETYRRLPADLAGVHFVVIIHRTPGSSQSLARPVGLVRKDLTETLIPTDELFGLLRQVVASDRERHPEWQLPDPGDLPRPQPLSRD